MTNNQLQIYIVCHNKQSYDIAPKQDGFKYILVGNDVKVFDGLDIDNIIIPCTLPWHIENFKSLLTFTAWYALVKNNLIKSKFVGIFEYDVVIKSNIYRELDENTIYGFFKRPIPDPLYLDAVPFFKDMLNPFHMDVALSNGFWCPTSNFIMPANFLREFVEWYWPMVPKIIEDRKHPHFHERAINVYAANYGFKTEVLRILEHLQLNSHEFNL